MLDSNFRVSLYETMLLIRTFEERTLALHRDGRAPNTCAAVGQEAAAAGAVAALTPQDRILTNHRSVGHLLARGAAPGRLLAEIFGRRDGYCRGRSGPLHISIADLGVVLTSTIVGGELSMAPGVALAHKMLGRDGIVAVFFGDGAACEGIFHEALNLASTWELPVLFLCENNEWQAFVDRRETMPGNPLVAWAAAHAMPAARVDGNDPEAVYAAVHEARETILRTGRPCFLELATYRLAGHMSVDDQAYVAADELAAARMAEPIVRQRDRLLAAGLLDSGSLRTIEVRVERMIDEAVSFAHASPFPDVRELLADVYA